MTVHSVAATDHGLVARLKSGVVQVFTNHIPPVYIESLAEDGEGAMWVKGRGGNTVSGSKDGQVTELPLAGASFRQLIADYRGQMWFINNGRGRPIPSRAI